MTLMLNNSDFDVASERTEPTNLTRRALLAATTGFTVGLAGCSGGGQTGSETPDAGTDGSGESSDTSSSNVFGEIGFDGHELEVSVSDDSVTRVNAIRDGEQVGNAEFSTGASKATVWTANRTLHGEEFELIAVDEEGDEIDSTTVSFSAQPEVSRLRTQAIKNGREATEEVAKEYTDEFRTALVTVENTGDGPLFLGKWRYNYREATTVFLTDGVPQAVGSEQRSELDEAEDRVLVPAGGSVEVVPYAPANLHLEFNTTGGERDAWPESVRAMGEFPDGYADGDAVDVSVVLTDDTGEQFESTVSATYDGGLIQTRDFNVDNYVPAEFSTEE